VSELVVCAETALPLGCCRIATRHLISIGVFNLDGSLVCPRRPLLARRRPLCEGEFDAEDAVVICPRHGVRFDIRSGRPLTLPATEPVATYPVFVRNGQIVIDTDQPSIAA